MSPQQSGPQFLEHLHSFAALRVHGAASGDGHSAELTHSAPNSAVAQVEHNTSI